jgi:hypothetical protein
LSCLGNLRFESDRRGSTPKIMDSNRDSKVLDQEPGLGGSEPDSNLESRDSSRGLSMCNEGMLTYMGSVAAGSTCLNGAISDS